MLKIAGLVPYCLEVRVQNGSPWAKSRAVFLGSLWRRVRFFACFGFWRLPAFLGLWPLLCLQSQQRCCVFTPLSASAFLPLKGCCGSPGESR